MAEVSLGSNEVLNSLAENIAETVERKRAASQKEPDIYRSGMRGQELSPQKRAEKEAAEKRKKAAEEKSKGKGKEKQSEGNGRKKVEFEAGMSKKQLQAELKKLQSEIEELKRPAGKGRVVIG